jgi:hypothetical protein
VATAGAWAKQAWPKSDTATKAIEKEKRRRESKAVMVGFPEERDRAEVEMHAGVY